MRMYEMGAVLEFDCLRCDISCSKLFITIYYYLLDFELSFAFRVEFYLSRWVLGSEAGIWKLGFFSL